MAYGILTIPMPGQSVGAAEAESAGVAEYLVGPENSLVEVAVRAVLEDQPSRYNPLLFCGASGTGKSHLARGLEGAWRVQYGRRRRVEYTTGGEFAQELTDAIKAQATDDLRTKYRAAALLIVEDLGQLEGRQTAQEELVHTLDALLIQGGRFLATASQLPSDLPGMIPALVSRLGAGLTVPLHPPGLVVRIALLRRFGERRGQPLDDCVTEVLAEGLKLTAPELLGALMQLETSAKFHGVNIDVRMARQFVDTCNEQNLPPLRDIAAAVARHFGVRVSDLRSASRQRNVVAARDVAMYLAREWMYGSFSEIGRYFGGRDHTTVLHGCRKAKALLTSDVATQQAVEAIQRRWRP